ncbi:MAG: GtrA family protein [Pseudomonadales bacterium]|nr:GtrA family protein [Pseudomonadales bacterium]MBO6564121.1 GtrA family protein [Pseudomonadales bacterium]MBO6597609.1 GtrA family protein [Pseudomonadales bacterium]MBO6657735.1 GtrA family protein [Pseudomonadales bacterium]MBO6704196.1 GtrA family protein [Pseudomonadales bacterium]
MAESEEFQGSTVHRTAGELVRFGVVGLAHNLLGYLVYLLITWLGTDPKIAVAILYPIGTAISFFANRRWTFEDKGHVGQSMSRYLAMHGFGYVLNILIIFLGVDLLQFPHQLVQLFAMGFLAVMFFLMSKFLVFNDR